MKRIYTVQLTVKGHDGTGHEQAARVTIHPSGVVVATTPIALKITEQLIAGASIGSATTEFCTVSFKLTDAEFIA